MRRQVVIMISIALVSFLAGTLLNMNFYATAGSSKPWDEIWQAIHTLQAQVQSLNQTTEKLKAQIPKKPMVITRYEPSKTIPYVQWVDMVSIPDVTVSEGADVIAIASTDILGVLFFRFRVNNDYGEVHSNIAQPAVELHYVWTNLEAGTYTFAVQGYGGSDTAVALNAKLTMIIT